MQFIDCVRRSHHRRAETEGHLGSHDVVIDRFRHADDRNSLASQVAGDIERAITADNDERIETKMMKCGYDLIRDIDRFNLAVLFDLEFEWISAIGGSKDRAARVNYAADVVSVEQMDAAWI